MSYSVYIVIEGGASYVDICDNSKDNEEEVLIVRRDITEEEYNALAKSGVEEA